MITRTSVLCQGGIFSIFLIFLWDNYSRMSGKRDLYTALAYARRVPGIGKLAYLILKLLGMEIPRSVQIGRDLEVAHGGFGIVIHPQTVIGERVKIYPGVTIGRADIHLPSNQSKFEGVVIEDNVILASGSKVLGKEGVLRVGNGTIVGANAVLLCSTGEGEIWAGVPARRIGNRDRLTMIQASLMSESKR
jgi:serine O-acetyltransferase